MRLRGLLLAAALAGALAGAAPRALAETTQIQGAPASSGCPLGSTVPAQNGFNYIAVDNYGNACVAVGNGYTPPSAGSTYSPTSGQSIPASGGIVSTSPTGTAGKLGGVTLDQLLRLIVQADAPNAAKANGMATMTASTSSTALIAAPGAGLYLHVRHIQCANSGATATTVSLQNGSGGTTIWEGTVAAGASFSAEVDIGGSTGAQTMSSNTGLYVQAGSSTSSLICNAQGYSAAS